MTTPRASETYVALTLDIARHAFYRTFYAAVTRQREGFMAVVSEVERLAEDFEAAWCAVTAAGCEPDFMTAIEAFANWIMQTVVRTGDVPVGQYARLTATRLIRESAE